jgi:hypothetical protein
MAGGNEGDVELTLGKRDDAPPAQRITETEFQARPSEWLQEAARGRQIIVVDEADRQKVTMVVGMNGIVFKPIETTDPATQAQPRGKRWIE